MKKQVVIIHGGYTFKNRRAYVAYLKRHRLDFRGLKNKDWHNSIAEDLGRSFEVIEPRMPNASDARYEEWKILLNKLWPFLKNGVVFIGHSLGGIFLAKYLSEKNFSKRIQATFLIAAPYSGGSRSLGTFALPKNLKRFEKQGGETFIYHSKDDPVVPFADFYKYKKALPNAHAVAFKHKGHFNQERFPELAKAIKKLR